MQSGGVKIKSQTQPPHEAGSCGRSDRRTDARRPTHRPEPDTLEAEIPRLARPRAVTYLGGVHEASTSESVEVNDSNADQIVDFLARLFARVAASV